VTPTPEALEVLAEVERLLAHEERVGDRIRAMRMAESGLLRIAGIPTLAESLMAWAIGDFAAARPQVRIRIDAYSAPRVVELVQRHEMDLGFVHGPVETGGLDVEELCEAELICIVPKAHRLARRRVLKLEDLFSERLVAAGPESAPGRLLRSVSDSLGLQLSFVAESNASAVRVALARRQNFITILDPWLPVTLPHAGLVIKRIEPRIVLKALVLSSPERPLSRLASDFKRACRKTVQEIMRKNRIIRSVTNA
jgi:DNA-binding transcriptional LysR family regulator